MSTDAAAAPATTDRLFGHPRALAFLAGTEFWDRVSFHGMQALLTLYMVEQLLAIYQACLRGERDFREIAAPATPAVAPVR